MEKKEYKIISVKTRQYLNNFSQSGLYSADIIINLEKMEIIKNRSRYDNVELAKLTNNFTNLDAINNPENENENYKFLLTKKR